MAAAAPVDLYEPEPPPAERKRQGHVKPTLRSFAGWTSAHGIPHIGSSRNYCLIIFWMLVVLAALALLIFNVVVLVKQYLRYDVAVGVELKFAQRPFPAVTVCDLNPYKKTEVDQMPASQRLLLTYRHALGKSGCSGSTCPNNSLLEDYLTIYGFDGIKDTAALQSKARSLLALSMAREATNVHKTAALVQRNDFIKSCSFNTKDCDIAGDFKDIEDPKLGMCFSFNWHSKHVAKRAGPIYGLRMILKTEVNQYLAISEAAGVRVVIHNQTEHPFPDILGYNIEVGSATSMGVTFREINRLDAPYGDCLKTTPSDYLYNGSYNTEGCQRGCFQRQIQQQCTCTDPVYPSDTDLPICDISNKPQRECWQKQSSSTKLDEEKCNCPQPCNEGVYDVTVSAARWPSGSLKKVADCKEGDYFTTCHEHYSKNGALVEIFYAKLNYELLDETPAYELVNLASDFGGQIGLWLGLSAISVVEFFVLFAFLTRNFCCPTGASPEFD